MKKLLYSLKLDSVKFLSADTQCVSVSPVYAQKHTEKFPQSFSQLKPDVISCCTVSAMKIFFVMSLCFSLCKPVVHKSASALKCSVFIEKPCIHDTDVYL